MHNAMICTEESVNKILQKISLGIFQEICLSNFFLTCLICSCKLPQKGWLPFGVDCGLQQKLPIFFVHTKTAVETRIWDHTKYRPLSISLSKYINMVLYIIYTIYDMQHRQYNFTQRAPRRSIVMLNTDRWSQVSGGFCV